MKSTKNWKHNHFLSFIFSSKVYNLSKLHLCLIVRLLRLEGYKDLFTNLTNHLRIFFVFSPHSYSSDSDNHFSENHTYLNSTSLTMKFTHNLTK